MHSANVIKVEGDETSPQMISSISEPISVGSKRNRIIQSSNASLNSDIENKKGKKIVHRESLSPMRDAGTSTDSKNCKQQDTVPIFLKKTYEMLENCDPNIATWTDDGEMFVVKDQDTFAKKVIPQYFDHSKFSSFARQVSFLV
mmetsp:Transcript_21707/g.30434  ORF Transcript_21707/g.30434 Transcript_21707/m.30434 type:complete len:144 (+) Transcript_21707:94-525(+)